MYKIEKNYYVIIVGIFSIFINYYYANLGVFPIDTFLHYGSGYKILNNDYPIRDYWIVSGFFVDFLQAFFFKVFGVSWSVYIIHSSIINFIISILFYKILESYQLSKVSCFCYAISFSTLAYTISGTPFLDLHGVYLCFIAFCLIIKNIINNNYNYFSWGLIVLLYFFAFLSKQVPASYLILLNLIFLTLFFFHLKKIRLIIFILILTILLILFFILFLSLLDINVLDFYVQYIEYPRFIGINRLKNFQFSFESFFNKFKFIIIPLFFLVILNINQLIKKKHTKYFQENIIFLILFSMVVILLINQLLTRNQIYIYFLIPLCFSFLEIEINKSKFRYKNSLHYLLIFLVISITIKYHLRYNEHRKFHELEKVELSRSINAKTINNDLKGLRWISPFYKNKPMEELNLLNNVIQFFKENKKNEVVLITHYSFLDSLVKKKLGSFNRTYTHDGVSMPLKNNEYFNYYVNFLYKKLIKKKIQKVYFIDFENINEEVLTDYIEEKCYIRTKDSIFTVFNINIKCLEGELKNQTNFK